MSVRGAAAVAGLAALGLAATPAALGRTTTSSNWAGYAVHRNGVTFEKVVGAWTEPATTCTPGRRTFSSAWIGLGGYSLTSNFLEQIGTEADCRANGTMVTHAWYELVPGPTHRLRMKVRPGNRMRASVTVVGTRVHLMLRDLTRRRKFARTVVASTVDVTSAEWVVEVPSECVNSVVCQPLSLANFGAMTFTHARAVATGGRSGSISGRGWDRTRIRLETDRHHTAAKPSALSDRGTQFTITYAGSAGSGSAPAAPLSSRQLLHIS
jgi:Peptidase A4 family